MRRREFLAGAAAFAAASSLSAQVPRVRRVALATPGVPEVDARNVDSIRNRLRELGWVEGRTVEYSYGYARGQGTGIEQERRNARPACPRGHTCPRVIE